MLNLDKLLKLKAIATVVLGLIFVIFPVQTLSFLGAESAASAVLVLRLFGAIAAAIGMEVLWAKPIKMPSRKASATYCLSDIVAIIFLIQAAGASVIGGVGCLLIAIYVVSALLFLAGAIRKEA